MRIVLLAAFALVGCEREQQSIASDCGTTAASLIKALQVPNEKVPEDAQKALTKGCVDDRWSPQAHACIQQARTYQSVEDCRYKQLTRQQDDHLQPLVESMDPGSAEVVTAMERHWTKMCACQDPTCAQAVAGEMATWLKDFRRKRRSPPRLSATKRVQLKAMGEQLNKCMKRATGTEP